MHSDEDIKQSLSNSNPISGYSVEAAGPRGKGRGNATICRRAILFICRRRVGSSLRTQRQYNFFFLPYPSAPSSRGSNASVPLLVFFYLFFYLFFISPPHGHVRSEMTPVGVTQNRADTSSRRVPARYVAIIANVR